MNNLVITSALTVLGTLAVMSFSPPSPSAPSAPELAPLAPRGESCSEKTLKGKWGFNLEGTIITGVGSIPPGMINIVGTLDSNGAGNFLSAGRANIQGAIVTQTATGTYSVKSDCTGTATFRYPGGWTMDLYFVVTGEGESKQVWFINTSLPAVLHGMARPR